MITVDQVFQCSRVSSPCRGRFRRSARPARSWCRWTTHLGRRKAVRSRIAIHGNKVLTTHAYLVAYATVATLLADACRISGNIEWFMKYPVSDCISHFMLILTLDF